MFCQQSSEKSRPKDDFTSGLETFMDAGGQVKSQESSTNVIS